MHIARTVLQEFELWFSTQAAEDSYFDGITASHLIDQAKEHSQKCVDELLTLPHRDLNLREWVDANLVPLEKENPFPDVRRKGGDDDRGFSPALNQEMRRRMKG